MVQTDLRDRPAIPLIEVTEQMIEAGLDELRQHWYAGDTRHMLESVYRAMAYESFSAAETSASK